MIDFVDKLLGGLEEAILFVFAMFMFLVLMGVLFSPFLVFFYLAGAFN